MQYPEKHGSRLEQGKCGSERDSVTSARLDKSDLEPLSRCKFVLGVPLGAGQLRGADAPEIESRTPHLCVSSSIGLERLFII